MQGRQQTAIAGPALVALAALCWGLSGGIAGLLMARGWDPFVLAFYRGAIGLVFVLGWLALRGRSSGLDNHRLWFWAGVAGLGVAGNFAFYFLSIGHSSIPVAATLMYCAPVYVFLASFVLKYEAVPRWKWLAVAIIAFGIALLTRVYAVDASEITLLAVVFGLLAGLCYAVFIFSFRFAGRYGSPQAVLAVAFLVLVSILFWLGEPGDTAAALISADSCLFLALGVLGAGLSFFIYVIGMRGTRPTTASVVAAIEPITASLFGVFVLSNALAAPQVLGIVLILMAVTALSVHQQH